MEESQIIAAVRTNQEFMIALNSKVKTVFMLNTNIDEIKEKVALAHENGKKIFVHIDLAEGIGKDAYGVKFLKNQGVDGIISTRTNLIKIARKEDVFTVQRFFVVDSQSIETTVESAFSSKADLIEIMPGIAGKVIERFAAGRIPVIAGGLIETKKEVTAALDHGALAVSTGRAELWYL
jgi:glycerol uptake operon antiterminator